MDNAALKQAAQQEMMRRAAKAELARRQDQAPEMASAGGAPEQPLSTFSDMTTGGQSGLTFGFDDEIYGGVAAIPRAAINAVRGQGFDLGEAYTQERDKVREMKGEARERSPIAFGAGEVLGGVGTGAGAGKAGLTLTGKAANTVRGRVARGAAEGAAYGGLYGAGNADGRNMASEVAKGAAIGGLTGGLVDGAVGGVKAMRSGKQAAQQAPNTDALRADADTLYSAARDAGVTIKQPAVTKAFNNMRMAAGRVNEQLAPKTSGMLKYIDELAGRDLGLDEMDEIRQVLNDALGSAEKRDQRLLLKMKETLDATVDKLGARDITGDLNGVELLKKGREVFSRKAKSEVLDEIHEKALNQATGYENGIVTQMRSLANNSKRMRQFSAEEQAMIKDVVRRGTGRGILRAFGMLSPTSTFGGMATGGAMMGTGILPGAIMGGTGMLARGAAGRATLGKFNQMANAARSGITPEMQQIRQITPGLLPATSLAGQTLVSGRSY